MNISDWTSFLIVPYTIVPYCVALYTHDIQWFILGFLMLFSMTTTYIIKSLTQNLSYSWLKRPEGASNCNTSNSDGDQSGYPGFPSGHSAGTATFWIGVWILSPTSYKTSVGFLAIIGIMSMMWAREKKRCHSKIQTIAGVLIGAGYTLLIPTIHKVYFE